MENIRYINQENQGGIRKITIILKHDSLAVADPVDGLVSSVDIENADKLAEIECDGSFEITKRTGIEGIYYETKLDFQLSKNDYDKYVFFDEFDKKNFLAIVQDNNFQNRLIGDVDNFAILPEQKEETGNSKANLNSYKCTITWKSVNKPFFLTDDFILNVLGFSNLPLIIARVAKYVNVGTKFLSYR